MGTDAMMGPDGRPSTFDGAAWISQDGKYWWNGAAWQPVRSQRFRPPIALAVVIVLVIGGAWLFFFRYLPSQPTAAVKLGVTHSRIDSSTQIEIDYARATTCNDLTFDFVFYDKSGHAVDRFVSEDHRRVTGGESHHFVFYTFDAIAIGAVRFDTLPTCHD